MVSLTSVVSRDRVVLNIAASNRRKVLTLMAAAAASELPTSAADLARKLENREIAGSTCLGNGVVLPRYMANDTLGCRVWIGRLSAPVDFGATDNHPVDIVALMVGSVTDRGQGQLVLKRLREVLGLSSVLSAIRHASTQRDIAHIIVSADASLAASDLSNIRTRLGVSKLG